MNRKDIIKILAIIVALVLAVLLVNRIDTAHETAETEIVRDAVKNAAITCYAVEGAYPNSVAYLEEHYGLVINHERYIVSYEAYSSNLAPSIRVLPLGSEDGEGY